MSVVAAYLYRDGRRAGPVELGQPIACSSDQSEFVWIGLLEPSEAELRILQESYGLHPLAVEDALKAHQLPKVDVYGEQLFVVARTAHLEGDQIEYGETAIFVGPSHIITVRHGSARHHATLRAQLEAAPRLLAKGVDYVLHGVLDFIVDGYLPIMETIEEEVLEMERRALDTMLEREAVTRIFHLRRQMIRFGRILEPMAELCSKLVRLDMPCIDRDARPYFSDVLDHVRRVQIRVGGLREILTSVFEISSLLEQQRQGAITRQLAAWAAILAVPTAIAGIYGMNFENMPELRSHYGYFVVLGVIALLCGLLYWRFKRARWL
ncbi:magnesium and cobalt transport protein CorA [Teichococcus oryzae]|uniref:Magnesium and cobalt transport protein CorA n=1 Tax=Teichococcus oryzae TaxID=1608942 RepID=A0A5B2TID4_9PROT|nr:magnesium and cobalt transport protein CorA [Pseudoroseomonas oryzae]KAA2214231.1 magnesium and cobalt transport protein CorA [Pseudoroseomonas oryzae]